MANIEENTLCKKFRETLSARLESYFRKPVEIVFKSVRSFLFHAKIRKSRIQISISSVCAIAKEEVFEAIFNSITKRDRGAIFFLQSLTGDNNLLKKQPVSKGSFYDLDDIFNYINKGYFNSELKLHIGWFGKGVKKNYRSITFGRFERPYNLILINRFLDNASVPVYFVEYVVYHEILHFISPPFYSNGKIIRHGANFKEKEKRFMYYKEAKIWEKKLVRQMYVRA